jgi:hypothetical protein
MQEKNSENALFYWLFRGLADGGYGYEIGVLVG